MLPPEPSMRRTERLLARPPFAVTALLFFALVFVLGMWLFPGWAWMRWVAPPWDAPLPSAGVTAAPLRPEDGVLLPADSAPRLAEVCSRSAPGQVQSSWVPTPREIAQLEHDLAPILAVAEKSRPGWDPKYFVPLTAYRRQYGGLTLLGGERIIYVNGFTPTQLLLWLDMGVDSAAWRVSPVHVCDGGDAFWGVEYEPRTRRFRQFAFNGSA